jgi:hypothetical protein
MPISVICPACKSRFSVSDQFAGRTGPCPKCKKSITIPKPAAQTVTIHEPDAPTASSAVGRAPTAPFKRRDKAVHVSSLAIAAAGAIACMVAAAILPRVFPPTETGDVTIPQWLLLGGAFVVAIPSVVLGYAAVRNRELEAWQGMDLAKRALACAVIYALLWGLRGLLPPEQTAEMWQWFYLGPMFVAAGAMAAFALFDIDWGNAIAHYSFYVLLCSLLRWLTGLLPL